MVNWCLFCSDQVKGLSQPLAAVEEQHPSLGPVVDGQRPVRHSLGHTHDVRNY